jgi:hypothetical protein
LVTSPLDNSSACTKWLQAIEKGGLKIPSRFMKYWSVTGWFCQSNVGVFWFGWRKEYRHEYRFALPIFSLEALQNPGKYENRTPKLAFDKGKLSVTSQIGSRAGLRAGAYDPVARIKALDEMQIDRQAISPSPILLFY